MSKIVHVVPVNDCIDHNANGLDCACSPTYKIPCEECEGSEEGCWNCEDGLIVISRVDAANEIGLIVVHDALDGRVDAEEEDE